MNNFWDTLQKPFFVLAPMADVTDAAFRRIITKYGKPDVLWTEFVSADGLSSEGREVLQYDLLYTEAERPIVAQLFSAHPDKMRQAAKMCAERGFDGIDINMGCPDRSIEKQGAGAAMMKTPEIAATIIQAVKDGIHDAGKDIPVSVKTRVGYNQVQIDEWIPFILSQDIACLTVHARTRKEMSKVPAQWDHIKKVVALRDKMGVKTRIIGNGDVRSVAHGKELALATGCDGIMIGRAIFGNPWLFSELHENTIPVKSTHTFLLKSCSARVVALAQGFFQKWYSRFVPSYKNRYWLKNTTTLSVPERLSVLIEHTKLFEEVLGPVKNFAIMKKHYKAYVNGFDGAKELRMKLMEAENAHDVEVCIREFLD